MQEAGTGDYAAGDWVKPTVYVVDDSVEMCRSMEALLSAFSFPASAFTSATEFLGRKNQLRPGVLLVDLRMEEMSGLELLAKLEGYHDKFPAIMITAHGDIEIAVKAIKTGARDFIQKPFRDDLLIETINRVAEELGRGDEGVLSAKDRLSGREREVAERLAKGLSNKQIAHDLGLSVRTVEMHRAKAMQRLGCKSFADLLRVLLAS